ncbi:MAG: selenoneine biosynthesis selenosugar synthase SenB [SAR324 cluster bacterium]
MRILIVTPAPSGSRLGNRISAQRWAALLRKLGHRVRIAQQYDRQRCDLLIGLHARTSAPSLRRFRRAHPALPVVLVLTGTDLYRDLQKPRTRAAVCASMAIADRIVTLNTQAVRGVPKRFRAKVRCILQSATAPPAVHAKRRRAGPAWPVAVVGHLRREKDPLRAAYAVRALPKESRLRVEQAGRALQSRWAERARAEMRRNARYRWLGELSRAQVARLLARSAALVHSSRMEGGANALAEAVVAGLPVLASDVPGNVGMLGARHPGLFPAGDTRELRKLLGRMEHDPGYRRRLLQASARLAARFAPALEARGWRSVLTELTRRGPD